MKDISLQKASTVMAGAATLSAFLALVSLAINVHNRVTIIGILSRESNGGVGFDAPLQYPLILSLVLLVASWALVKRKLSLLQTVCLTMLFVVGFVWVFGLNMAVENTFQKDVVAVATSFL